MDSKIIGLIAGSFLLTGCISAKVEQLHTTTTQLSTDIDNYVAMSNRVVELNQKSTSSIINLNLDQGVRTLINKNEALGEESDDTKDFNRNFIEIYINYSLAEDVKQLNNLVSEYFKTLPKILENKDIDDKVKGLVKNIDVLNQAIENNLSVEDANFKGGLKPVQEELIDKTLVYGLKIYQYHLFEKEIERHHNILLNSLILLKYYTYATNQKATFNLNNEFWKTHKYLLDSYIKQHIEASKDQSIDRTNIEYRNEDFEKMEAFLKQPIILNSSYNHSIDMSKPNKYRSNTYLETCTSNTDNLTSDLFKKPNTIQFYNVKNPNIKPVEYSFNLEKIVYLRGDAPTCELINIIGLLKEKKYNQIELKTLEKTTSNYNAVLDYLIKIYTHD
jgi:hypothetical protein